MARRDAQAAAVHATLSRRYHRRPMTRKLTQGNEAVFRGALAAGASYYAGYPISPSTEILNIASGHAAEHPVVHEVGHAPLHGLLDLGAGLVHHLAQVGEKIWIDGTPVAEVQPNGGGCTLFTPPMPYCAATYHEDTCEPGHDHEMWPENEDTAGCRATSGASSVFVGFALLALARRQRRN